MIARPDVVVGAVLDVDGVVTDTASLHLAAWTYLFEELFAVRSVEPPFTVDDYRRLVDGRAREAGLRAVLADRGIEIPVGEPSDGPTLTTTNGLAKRKQDLFLAMADERGVTVFDDAVVLLDEAARRRLPVVAASASRNCRHVLDVAGIRSRFADVVDGTDADMLRLGSKPDPALFLEAARRIGHPPAGLMLIEDAIAGLQAARSGGFGLVVGIDRIGTSRDELRQAGAHRVVGDLRELLDVPVRVGENLPVPLGHPA